MISIAYYVNGRMPSNKANGYQSAQMCKGLLEQRGVLLQLFHQSRSKNVKEFVNSDIKGHYNLDVDFRSSSIFCIDFVWLLEKFPLIFRLRSFYVFSEYLTTFSSLWFLYGVIKKTKVDYLYIRSNQVLIGLGLFFPNVFLKKVIFEVHDLNSSFLARKLFFKYLDKVKSVITVTRFLKDDLVLNGVDSKKIIVEPDCVDLDRFKSSLTIFESRSMLNINAEDIIVGYVGRFTTIGNEKGIPEIIRAAESVLKKFEKVKFYFVGGSRFEIDKYNLLITRLGLNKEAFVFIESQHVSKIPIYLWACNILLMPHPKTHFYSFNVSPLKLFEYMAAGRPIIASNLPSICEVLMHRKNSLLVAPGSHIAICNSILELLEDHVLNEKISTNALNDVKKYTWNIRAKRVLESLL